MNVLLYRTPWGDYCFQDLPTLHIGRGFASWHQALDGWLWYIFRRVTGHYWEAES